MEWNVADIGAWLQTVEWYDNHSLQAWLDCKRKSYFNREITLVKPDGTEYRGLESAVGNGGKFGGATHAGLAAYYTRFGQPNEARRDAAYRAFDREYTKRIGDPTMEESLANTVVKGGKDDEEGEGRKKYALESKHRRARGMVILAEYFDKYQREDSLFRPVDAELGFLVRYHDPVGHRDPFWYVARIDGLFENVQTRDWFILETKTGAGGAARECKRLTFNRQPTGYVVGLRRFEDGSRVQGFLANAILVAAQKIDFKREFFPVRKTEEEEWILETFNIVEEIRAARASGDVHRYFKNTGHCTAYGLCHYWDICNMGLRVFLQTPQAQEVFRPNMWHPFKTAEEDQ